MKCGAVVSEEPGRKDAVSARRRRNEHECRRRALAGRMRQQTRAQQVAELLRALTSEQVRTAGLIHLRAARVGGADGSSDVHLKAHCHLHECERRYGAVKLNTVSSYFITNPKLCSMYNLPELGSHFTYYFVQFMQMIFLSVYIKMI